VLQRIPGNSIAVIRDMKKGTEGHQGIYSVYSREDQKMKRKLLE
jgi:hypothetical protein